MIINDDGLRAILDTSTFALLLVWVGNGMGNLLIPDCETVRFRYIHHFAFCGVPPPATTSSATPRQRFHSAVFPSRESLRSTWCSTENWL